MPALVLPHFYGCHRYFWDNVMESVDSTCHLVLNLSKVTWFLGSAFENETTWDLIRAPGSLNKSRFYIFFASKFRYLVKNTLVSKNCLWFIELRAFDRYECSNYDYLYVCTKGSGLCGVIWQVLPSPFRPNYFLLHLVVAQRWLF